MVERLRTTRGKPLITPEIYQRLPSLYDNRMIVRRRPAPLPDQVAPLLVAEFEKLALSDRSAMG
jgi:hypothetical protein